MNNIERAAAWTLALATAASAMLTASVVWQWRPEPEPTFNECSADILNGLTLDQKMSDDTTYLIYAACRDYAID